MPQPVIRTLPVGGSPDTVPFVVRPERQIWIGRSAYRRFTVSARVAGDEAPVLPRYAMFRQRPWLPWWIAILIPLIALGVALYLALMPKMVTVPNLIGAKSTFAAEQMLQQKGLMLNPNVQAQASSKPAGSVIGQTPKPDASVKKGSQVSILIAAGSGLATVPQLKGKTVTQADQILTKAGLTLGMVLPTPKPNGVIGSQIPAPGLKRKTGTPVNVFLKPPPHTGRAGGKTTSTAKPSSTPAGAGSPGGGGAGAGAATIAVPKPAGATLTAYNAMLTKAGLTAGPATWKIDTAPRTTVIATDPAAGTKVKAGTTVSTTVSAGYPDLAFDDGGGIVVLHGYTGAPVARFGVASDSSPTWSPNGNTIVNTTGPVLLATETKHPKRAAEQLTAPAPGVTWTNPAFAPTTTKHVLAMIRDGSGPDALCFLARRHAAGGLAQVPRGSRLDAVRDRVVAGRTLDARLGSEHDRKRDVRFAPLRGNGAVRGQPRAVEHERESGHPHRCRSGSPGSADLAGRSLDGGDLKPRDRVLPGRAHEADRPVPQEVEAASAARLRRRVAV